MQTQDFFIRMKVFEQNSVLELCLQVPWGGRGLGYCYDRHLKMIQEYAQIPGSAILRQLSRFIELSSSCSIEERSALSTYSKELPVVGCFPQKSPLLGAGTLVPVSQERVQASRLQTHVLFLWPTVFGFCFPHSDIGLTECHLHRNSCSLVVVQTP